MKIVFVEVRGGQEFGRREFEQTVIVAGRDPAVCDILFDQTEWPMVSRRHGEFRLADGEWRLSDNNSSFGTFLDGQRVAQPVPVRAGAEIQFGAGGPVMRVVAVEGAKPAPALPDANEPTLIEFLTPPPSPSPSPASTPPVSKPPVSAPLASAGPSLQKATPAGRAPTPPASSQQAPIPPTPPAASPRVPITRAGERPAASPAAGSSAAIEFVNRESGDIERVGLNGDSMLLGRDPSSGVPMDAAAAVVSRRHAEIQRHDGEFTLVDLASFNGTLLNGGRIAAPAPLRDGDRIQLGVGGPILRFVDPTRPAPHEAREELFAESVSVIAPAPSAAGSFTAKLQHTMVVRPGGTSGPLGQKAFAAAGATSAAPQLMTRRSFDGRAHLTIGRAPDNDIRLDGLQISNHHARFVRGGDSGAVFIEDAGSTNGVYLNGARITSRRPVQPGDIVQIGPFIVQAAAEGGVAVFDTRSKTRLDAVQIMKEVSDRARGTIKLLDDVALTIQPNEFVGLLGPSGAGKSTLMDALNGTRPATAGRVLINNLDLYQHLESLKQSIGYVPQDDIIHRELTVYRTLYYVARLRLSRDVSAEEIDQIVSEVLDVTGLGERRDVPVAQLSGGQRKRVSIAVELLTKPSVIFLDEPTSGLDPATEEKIMRLFRQIAESGRTVILTTHAMENVRLFDKIAILMRGKLIFYGTPQEALAHAGAATFRDLFEKLEESTATGQGGLASLPPNATAEQKRTYDGGRDEVAEEWRRRFHRTEVYRRNVVEPLSGLTHDGQTAPVAHRRPTIADAVRQFLTLVRRYAEVLRRDRLNLLILFAQAPIIAVLTFLVVGSEAPRDFPYFLLALVALWFGTSVAAREIVKERAVYKRERMVNLSLLPYVGSKLFVLSLIVGAQCVLLFGTLKVLSTVLSSADYLPGNFFQLGAQLLTLILTGMVGIALGLFVSAIVKTSEMATSLVPLILIPQLLFSGLVGVPEGAARVVGAAMPATWAFDEMKRLSGLDTLSKEGSDQEGRNQGRGLFKQIEHENEQVITQARKDIENYRARAEREMKDYEQKMGEFLQRGASVPGASPPPEPPVLGQPPAVKDARYRDPDLSGYVEFLHPWGGVARDAAILSVMLLIFFGATVIALRVRDR